MVPDPNIRLNQAENFGFARGWHNMPSGPESNAIGSVTEALSRRQAVSVDRSLDRRPDFSIVVRVLVHPYVEKANRAAIDGTPSRLSL
jgi:hypothetical protein